MSGLKPSYPVEKLGGRDVNNKRKTRIDSIY